VAFELTNGSPFALKTSLVTSQAGVHPESVYTNAGQPLT